MLIESQIYIDEEIAKLNLKNSGENESGADINNEAFEQFKL